MDVNNTYIEFKNQYIDLQNNMSEDLMFNISDMIEQLLYNDRQSAGVKSEDILFHENLLLNLLFSLLLKDGKINYRNSKCDSMLADILENWLNPNISEKQGTMYALKVIGYVDKMICGNNFKMCCECLRVY